MIGLGPRGESGVYVLGDIFGEKIHMVVDTGSTICMISLMVWNRVKRSGMTLRTTTTKLWTVDGSVARSYGRRILPLTIGGVTKKQMVEVTDCQYEFILGMNFMRAHVDGLNFKALRMKMASQDVEMTLVNVPRMEDRQEEQRRKAVQGQACGEDKKPSDDESTGTETDSGSDED